MGRAKTKLVPPDLKRCQAMYKPGSFMTLGPRSWVRCDKKPVWVIKEKTPTEGQKECGSMSLCADCAEVYKESNDESLVTWTKIEAPERSSKCRCQSSCTGSGNCRKKHAKQR